MPSIHASAANGFSVAADQYQSGRPDYPQALEHWLADTLHLGPGKRVLDLGAGTGKFTARLVATGAEVLAVEPVDAMRARLVAQYPGVEALGGTAEAIPLPDASLDAVVCAQAFHWFSTRAALAEIRRVLKHGGVLGLVWNTRDESTPWVAGLTGIIAPYEGDTPRYHSGEWRKPFPAPGFGELAETRMPHGHTGSPEQVIVGRTLSISFVAALPEAKRNEVAAKVRARIAADPALAGKAEITFPYITRAFSAKAV